MFALVFASLDVLNGEEKPSHPSFVYPFYEEVPVLVEKEGADNLKNSVETLSLEIDPLSLYIQDDLCEFDEICDECEELDEEQECNDANRCCCCQSSEGSDELTGLGPLGGFAVGGSGAAGIGFGGFGGGFAAGLGGGSSGGSSSNGGSGGGGSPPGGGPPGGPPPGGPPGVPIPEPSTWMILGSFLLFFMLIGVKKRSAKIKSRD